MEALYVILALALIFGPLILAIVALTKASSAQRSISQSRATVSRLSQQIADLQSELGVIKRQTDAPATPEPGAGVQAPPVVAGDEEPEISDDHSDEPQPSSESPEYVRPWERSQDAQPATTATPQPAYSAAEAPEFPAAKKPNFEETLTSRWLVWLGGGVIALGSIFLVKFAIDQNYLGPAVRDSLTFLFGVILVFGGEWLRRRPLQREIAAIRTNYVPLALTASGLIAAFASIYAAHTLHGLLGPIPAFAGLAIVALIAVGLSLLQGKFVALLGLLGAFVTPVLIATPDPSLWALLSYLIVIQAACLTVVYYQKWWSLGYATLAAVIGWPVFIWSRLGWSDAEVIPLGCYLLLGVGGFLLMRHRLDSADISNSQQSWFEKIVTGKPNDTLAWLAAILIAVLIFGVVSAVEFSPVSLLFLAVLAALYLVMGRMTPVLEGLAVVAAIVTALLLVGWPYFYGSPENSTFIWVYVLFGALFGLGGFAALWGAERPALWAAVSIAVPLVLFINAFGWIADFQANFRWIGLALGLGAIGLAATARVVVYRNAYGLSISLGFYAAGVVAFVSLAATMVLEQAWLTAALSVQLLALGWIYRHLPERSLEKIAAIIAGAVLIRLAANPNVLDYSVVNTSVFSWIVYGYGIPALSFFGAAKLFKDAKSPYLVTLLEAGSLVFFVLLVSSQIRLFVAGSLDSVHYSLLEQSLQSIAWLSIGTVLAIRHQVRATVFTLYGSRVLLGLAALQIVFVQLLFSNPFISGENVGDYPVVNTLLLAYAVPAAFAFFLAKRFQQQSPPWPALVSAVLGFVLVFAYLSLEVRHAYQGPVLHSSLQTDTEFYTYSLVWLVYALVLLGIGIAAKSTLPRYVSLAVLLITVLKAFLFDMADLSGLLRVSTFLILGLTLVGIGYLYQRFVFRVPASGPAGPAGRAGEAVAADSS